MDLCWQSHVHLCSSIFVPEWTDVIGDNMIKVLSWYDNEWGYSCRAVDLIEKMANM